MLNIAQQLFANTGEAKIESLDSEKKFCLGLFANGIWEKRRTQVGDFVQCVHPMQIGYLTKTCEPSFRMLLPKLPVGIFTETVRFFRQILQTVKSEVMVQIFWDIQNKKYVIFVPKQEVAGASIKCTRDEGMMVDPNYVWVFDIHSHCNFGAFFSGVDTGDEKSTRLFGVIGMLGQETPAHVWRAGFNQKFVDLKFEDIWDIDSGELFTVGENAIKNVTEMKYAATKIMTSGQPVHTRNPNNNAKQLNANRNQSRNYMSRIASQYERFKSFVPDFDNIDTSLDNQITEQKDLFPDLVCAQNNKYNEAINTFRDALADWASDILQFEQTNEKVLIEAMFEMLEECDTTMPQVAEDTADSLTAYLNQKEWNKFSEYITGLN